MFNQTKPTLMRLLTFLCLAFLALAFLLVDNVVLAQDSTNATLSIQSENLVIGPFSINPSQILVDEDLVFSLTDIRLGTGGFATGLTCRMFLTTPEGSAVELTMLVDSEGNCIYDTSLDLASQGITLVSGDVNLLNTELGTGSGYVEIEYLGETVTSNTDTYEVVDLTLITPQFEIVPTNILVGENLVFSLTNARFSNGQIAEGLECRHFLTAPDASEVELVGITNDSGECIYNTSEGLVRGFGIRAIAQSMGLVSGDVNRLNQVVGSGSGFGEVYYNNVAYRTNNDTYLVGQVDEEPEDPVTEIVRIITRTGGVYGGFIIFVSAILIVGGVYVSLRGDIE